MESSNGFMPRTEVYTYTESTMYGSAQLSLASNCEVYIICSVSKSSGCTEIHTLETVGRIILVTLVQAG